MGKIRCRECDMILESKHRHDFQKCNCPNESFVDGGNDYLRIGGVDITKVEVLNEDDTKE